MQNTPSDNYAPHNDPNHYQNNYQSVSDHNGAYPTRGQFQHQYGNQPSTHNRFLPLQHQGPRREFSTSSLCPTQSGGDWLDVTPQQAVYDNRSKENKNKRGRRGGRRVQKSKTPIGTGIYNLSGTPLNEEEIQVLDRGLKYAPTRNLNTFQTYVSIQQKFEH